MSALDSHRIAAIEPGRLVSHYPRPIGRNARLGAHGSGPTLDIVTIRTDAGATGWGLLAGSPPDPAALVGRTVADLFDPAIGVIDGAALALDFALHDLAGVILGQPVWRMLGALGPTAVPVYSGAIYFADLDPEDAPAGIDGVLRDCAADHAAGYRAFKLKIGRGYRWMPPAEGLARDVAVTRAVRAAYPDHQILVDANDGFTLETALEYLDATRDCDLFWLEEPFAENPADLRGLRAHLDGAGLATLVADGEVAPDLPALLDMAGNGLLDVLLMDIVSFGLTAWRAAMPALREAGIRASPHAWGVPVKSLYTAQLAVGLGDVVTVEGVPGVADGIDTSGYRLVDGLLHVPDRPGFGIAPPAAEPVAAAGGLAAEDSAPGGPAGHGGLSDKGQRRP